MMESVSRPLAKMDKGAVGGIGAAIAVDGAGAVRSETVSAISARLLAR